MPLRKHQAELARLVSQPVEKLDQMGRKIVAHVCPGGGKSMLPAIAGSILKRRGLIDKIVVVVPRLTLRAQMAKDFLSHRKRQIAGHELEIFEATNEPNPDKGKDGYVTTYDAIRSEASISLFSRGVHLDYFNRHRVLLCLDECHHIATGSALHDAIGPLFDLAHFRLLQSGTFDRNDGRPIAGIDYGLPNGDGRKHPQTHISYPPSDGLRDRTLIQCDFHHIDGAVAYLDQASARVDIPSLAEAEDGSDSLFAALRTDYAHQLLDTCVKHWRRYREMTDPRSLLLVVCGNITEAKKAKGWLDQMQVESAIATSEESDKAQQAIRRFREEGTPSALITVAMAYEGMDVPALTHLACLTHYRSFPWLLQLFGRVQRYDDNRLALPWEKQRAYLWVPDDPAMQQAISYIRDEELLGITQTEPSDLELPTTSADEATSREANEPGKSTDPRLIIPLDGRMTRTRVSGQDEQTDLTYEDTARLQAAIELHHLGCSVTAFAAALRGLGVNLPALPSGATSPEPDHRVLTSRERMDKIRSAIQTLACRLDAADNLHYGAWNQRCFEGPQRYQSREALSEADLLQVWRWLCRHARQKGIQQEENL